jgi:hypothetical protein
MLKVLLAAGGWSLAPAREAWLGTLVREERSTEVLAVCAPEWGRGKGLELVSEAVGVAEETDQPRVLRARSGLSERRLERGMSSTGAGSASGTSSWASWIVKGVFRSEGGIG